LSSRRYVRASCFRWASSVDAFCANVVGIASDYTAPRRPGVRKGVYAGARTRFLSLAAPSATRRSSVERRTPWDDRGERPSSSR
jgi:hypothetical protein